MAEQQEDRIQQYWQENSIGGILDKLGWSSKSGRKVTQILRAKGEIIPRGLTGKALLDLTKDTIDDVYCVETLIYRGTGNPEIRQALAQHNVYLRKEKPAGDFGFLRKYEARRLKVTELRDHEKALIILDGVREDAEILIEKIDRIYKEKGFTRADT
jgi:hypothetical protein